MSFCKRFKKCLFAASLRSRISTSELNEFFIRHQHHSIVCWENKEHLTRIMVLILGLSRYTALGKMFHLVGRLKMKGLCKVIFKVPPLWHTLAGYFQKLGQSNQELLEENWLEHPTLGEVSNFQWNRRIVPIRGVLRKKGWEGICLTLETSWL